MFGILDELCDWARACKNGMCESRKGIYLTIQDEGL